MNAAIKTTGLSHSFGSNRVLENLSFTVPKGDFFIIIGPNGSGKTTLLKIIAGLLKHQSGQLEILGRSADDYSRRKLAQTVSVVSQITSVDFPFTAREIVLMGRTPYMGLLGVEDQNDFKIADRSIHFTGIDHIAHREVGQLSGGEQQRVFIARAVCQEPDLILLDEPTASLDLAHQVRVMDLMEKLKEENGTTIVMVSHDLNLAAMYGDRLLLLNQGQIECQGRPADVLTYRTLENVYQCTLLVDQSPLGKFPRVTVVPEKFYAE
jgi:iron complex transport system ATP-binding protein